MELNLKPSNLQTNALLLSYYASLPDLPPQHHVIKRDAEIWAGRQNLSHLDFDCNLLVVGPSLTLQVNHLVENGWQRPLFSTLVDTSCSEWNNDANGFKRIFTHKKMQFDPLKQKALVFLPSRSRLLMGNAWEWHLPHQAAQGGRE